MLRKLVLHVVASSFFVAIVVSGHAEISGSGFRDIGCTGEFTLNLFMDHNGDGTQGKNEEGFPRAELLVSLTNYPAMGKEKFVADTDGFVRIGALCKGVFSIDVDPATIPAGAVFEGVYESGRIIIDASLDDTISVPLAGGTDFTAPGIRYLDIAFGTVTRGLK